MFFGFEVMSHLLLLLFLLLPRVRELLALPEDRLGSRPRLSLRHDEQSSQYCHWKGGGDVLGGGGNRTKTQRDDSVTSPLTLGLP